MNLYNVVELMTRRAVDQMLPVTECCSCEQCKLDASAVALNHLKPHYVVSALGETLTINSYMSAPKQAEIIAEVVKALEFVGKNPRHTL